MTDDTVPGLWSHVFDGSNGLALLAWLVLVFGPRRYGWLNALIRIGAPATLAGCYVAILFTQLGKAQGGFGSIEQVRALFATDPVLVAGWQHYLAFDLFVGGWAARHFDEAGLRRFSQAPVLALVFLAGPVGFLLALLVLGGLRLRRRAPPELKP